MYKDVNLKPSSYVANIIDGLFSNRFYRLYANRGNQRPDDVLHRLHQSTVAIIGLGGVGSWAAEALCRSGVGNLILIDLDDICISNTNRQLHALTSTVGQMKIDEMKRRLLDINPGCNVTLM